MYLCNSSIGYRQQVCLGCQAEVVHGATRSEREEAAKIGLLLGGLLSFFFFVMFPEWMETVVAWRVPPGLGLGIYALPVAGALALVVAFGAVQLEENRHRKSPPRFFRPMIANR